MSEIEEIHVNTIFNELCHHLSNDGCVKTVSENFKALKTNKDRTLLAHEYISKYNLFPNIIKTNKNNMYSMEFRQSGNKEFGNKNDINALTLYNKSIAYSENNSEYTAIAFANRSAVLFHMGYYKECLQDIEYALKEQYPQHLKQKINQRLTKANSLLKQTKKFVYYHEIPTLKTKANDTIPCATESVKVNYTSELGRHVITTQNIAPGDVIAIEEPYITILLADYYYTHCHHCLTRTLNPVQCQYCPSVMFCNVKCRDLAHQQYHQYECPILSSLLSLNIGQMGALALRTTIKARTYFQELINNNYTIEEYISKDDKKYYSSDYYNSIHNLVANTEQRDVKDLFQKAVKAAVILYLLENYTNFMDDSLEVNKSEIKNVTAELLMLHLQTAPSNMHQVSEHQKNKTDKGFESTEIGAGAYGFLSLLNHSCAPNVVRRSHGTTIVLRALRPIQIGQQLFDNYGFHHAVMTKTERKQNLKSQYHFGCNCEACVNNWPLYNNLLSKDDSINYFLSDVITALFEDNLIEAKKYLAQILENACILEKSVPSKELADIQEIVKEYYGLQGNKFAGY